ncbi:AAA family ATPase, partial [Enterococcus hirae]|uniref:AAA family ATPase n=1 Tax=Enterococcus hirae TaxID=1354 RepID=UPI00136E3195
GSWPNRPTSSPAGHAAPPTGPAGATASTGTPPQATPGASSASPPATNGATSPPGAGGPAGAAAPGSTPDTAPRTTWWPKDLTGVLTGVTTEPEPTHLIREDGQALFYAGKVNGIIGESESGKTWVALHAVHQSLDAGQRVTYVDFEDTAAGVVTRLKAADATNDQLADLFAYIGPDESLDALASGDLHEHLATTSPALIVLDGVNAAMTLLGLDLNSNTDATVFAQRVLRPLSATGACVVYIDHIPKSKDHDTKGGIGAQAKRAMTTGCTLRADVLAPFGRGRSGKLRLTVDKDRPGHVRGASASAKYAGTAVLESDPGTGDVHLRVDQPEGLDAVSDNAPFRPTRLMEKVSHFLTTIPDGASGYAIEKEVSGKASAIRVALELLAEEGYTRREAGARNSVLHHHVKPYTEAGELVSTPTSSTSSRPRPDLVPDEVREGDRRPRPTSSHTPNYVGVEVDEVEGPTGPTGDTSLRPAHWDEVERACHGCGDLDATDLYAGLCVTCRKTSA